MKAETETATHKFIRSLIVKCRDYDLSFPLRIPINDTHLLHDLIKDTIILKLEGQQK